SDMLWTAAITARESRPPVKPMTVRYRGCKNRTYARKYSSQTSARSSKLCADALARGQYRWVRPVCRSSSLFGMRCTTSSYRVRSPGRKRVTLARYSSLAMYFLMRCETRNPRHSAMSDEWEEKTGCSSRVRKTEIGRAHV